MIADVEWSAILEPLEKGRHRHAAEDALYWIILITDVFRSSESQD
jgi:hypothetical protein